MASTSKAARQLSDGNSQGTILGTAATDLIGFYGVATAVAQRASGSGAAVTTTASTTTSPAGYTTTTQANAIVTLLNEIRATLTGVGLMVGS